MTDVFVLGNGRSRLSIDLNWLAQRGPIYGCNALYREFAPAVLVSTDRPISAEIQQSGYAAQHVMYTRKPIPGLGARPVPHQYYGFSSGPLAVAIAALDQFSNIYMIGFDLGPLPGERFNNVYADTEFYKKSTARPTFTGNWVRQICNLARDFPRVNLIRVMGETTTEIEQFNRVSNLYKLSISDFQQRLNNAKDS